MTKKEMKKLLKEKKQVIIVAGVSHVNTPYTFHPQFVIEDSEKKLTSEKEVYNFLVKNGVKPFAWGICANYDGWANLTVAIFNSGNEKDWNRSVLEAHNPDEQDPDYFYVD
jgi:hypothetical protein